MAKAHKRPARKVSAEQAALTAFTKLPKRTGVLSAKRMNEYLDSLAKQRARYDHHVAQRAEDQLLRNFAEVQQRSAHGMLMPANWQHAYFPGLADLPMPRPPPHP
jgi:hypothetical protein